MLLGIHSALVWSNRFFVSLEGPSDFVLPPQTAIWWFLPGFAAITFAWDVTLWIWRQFSNERELALFRYWTNLQAGFDSTHILRIIGVLVVLPIALFTTLAIPQHVVLQSQVIRQRGYGFGAAETYRYTDARRLTLVDGFRQRDGKLVRKAGIVLDFADGRRWSSADIGDFRRAIDPALLNYLQLKTGLELHHEGAESDIQSSKSKQ